MVQGRAMQKAFVLAMLLALGSVLVGLPACGGEEAAVEPTPVVIPEGDPTIQETVTEVPHRTRIDDTETFATANVVLTAPADGQPCTASAQVFGSQDQDVTVEPGKRAGIDLAMGGSGRGTISFRSEECVGVTVQVWVALRE